MIYVENAVLLKLINLELDNNIFNSYGFVISSGFLNLILNQVNIKNTKCSSSSSSSSSTSL